MRSPRENEEKNQDDEEVPERIRLPQPTSKTPTEWIIKMLIKNGS